jgi:hypothetical protein
MYIEISPKVTISGWWLSPSPLKNDGVGMMKFPRYGKIKAMFQTTNHW